MIVYMPLCYQCSVIAVLLVPVGDTWLVATAKADNQGFLSGRPCQRAIADLTGPLPMRTFAVRAIGTDSDSTCELMIVPTPDTGRWWPLIEGRSGYELVPKQMNE